MRRVVVDDWGSVMYGRYGGETLEAKPDDDGRWSIYPQRHPNRIIYRWMTKREARKAMQSHFEEERS
jgi:hypothetical protein